MTLMAKVDSIKNALGGADKFHTSTVVGILEEANTMMGIKTEGVIAKRVEKVLAEIDIHKNKVVPSLQSTCVALVLRSAGHYDDDSKEAISELLTAHFLRDCCDALEAPASFTPALHGPVQA